MTDQPKDNVVHLNADLKGKRKVTGVPYTTPAQAIADALNTGDFNKSVVGRGWVELKIVAKFEAKGAIFHSFQASGVVMQNNLADAVSADLHGVEPPPPIDRVEVGRQEKPKGVDAPVMYVLRTMAHLAKRERSACIHKATTGEMENLDSTLSEMKESDLYNLALLVVNGARHDEWLEIMEMNGEYEVLRSIYERASK